MGYARNLDYIYKESLMYEETMKFENNFIVPSDFVANTYRRYYPDKNYIVFPFGIFKSPYYRKKIQITSSHKFKFIYVGRISIEKGCDILLNYFQEHTEYELTIIGSVLESEKEYFEKYKECTNIIFKGVVPNKEVPLIASKCDIGIHLSRFDAYSLAVGEIIGSGLPVVVSSETGNSTDIEKYGWGCVTKLNKKSIIESISKVTNIKNYNSFADNIDRYLNEIHPTYSQKILSFYKSVLENGKI